MKSIYTSHRHRFDFATFFVIIATVLCAISVIIGLTFMLGITLTEELATPIISNEFYTEAVVTHCEMQARTTSKGKVTGYSYLIFCRNDNQSYVITVSSKTYANCAVGDSIQIYGYDKNYSFLSYKWANQVLTIVQ